MNKHPNATVASATGALAVLIIWLLGFFNVNLSAEDGAVIAGVVIGIVLFIGKNGLVGLAHRIWRGNPKT